MGQTAGFYLKNAWRYNPSGKNPNVESKYDVYMVAADRPGSRPGTSFPSTENTCVISNLGLSPVTEKRQRQSCDYLRSLPALIGAVLGCWSQDMRCHSCMVRSKQVWNCLACSERRTDWTALGLSPFLYAQPLYKICHVVHFQGFWTRELCSTVHTAKKTRWRHRHV